MNDEIREILDYFRKYATIRENTMISEIKDYITNLQQENQKLKEKLNCKEYFSSTMPEDTEFVILTKNNYDRQQKDIQLELIDYKSRVDKAVEYIKEHIRIDDEYPAYMEMLVEERDNLLNILQNGSEVDYE